MPLVPAPNQTPGGGAPIETVDATPETFVYQHPQPLLQVETGHETHVWHGTGPVDWTELVLGQDGEDDTLTLAASQLDMTRAYGASNPQGLAAQLARYRPDRRVRLIAPWIGDDGVVLFQGYPITAGINWQQDAQGVTGKCLSEGQERWRHGGFTHVLGRHLRGRPLQPWDPDAPDHQRVPALPVVFNANGKPNRSAEAYPFFDNDGQFALHLFLEDDAPEAEYWTYAQALRYLLWHYVRAVGSPVSTYAFYGDTDEIAQDNQGGGIDENNPLLQLLLKQPRDLSVESMSVDEAVAVLCEQAGLHYQIALRSATTAGTNAASFFLRIYATITNAAEDQATPTDLLMGAPVVRTIERLAPFADVSGLEPRDIAEQGRDQSCTVTLDYRGTNDIIGRGGVETYEVIVLLRPGWAPHPWLDDIPLPITYDAAIQFWQDEFDPEFAINDDGTSSRIPKSIYHTGHPQHASVADVFRLWIFPDDWRYAAASPPLARAGNGGPLFTADWYLPHVAASDPPVSIWVDGGMGANLRTDIAGDWVPRRRPFGNTIGRRSRSSDNRSPVVLFNFTATTPLEAAFDLGNPDRWVEYVGAVYVDESRAAIRLNEGDIWGGLPFLVEPDLGVSSEKAIERYINGQMYVAVVATVRGDRRLSFAVTPSWPSARNRTQVIDYGHQQYRKLVRGAGLNFLPLDDEPPYSTRDDTDKIIAAIQRDATLAGVITASCDPETFRLDASFRPGDSISGIPGLGVDFDPYPVVQSVRYTKTDGAIRTTVHSADLRTAQEVLGDD